MQKSMDYIRKISRRYLIFFKWLVLAFIIGGVVGSIGTLFHYAIDQATTFRINSPWLVFLLPIAGILIVFLYQLASQTEDISTNLVLESIRSSKHLPLIMAPLIFISTTLTHLVGGSSGREGAALQLGGSLSTFIGERFHLDNDDLRILTMCGMSAAFAALFRTPIGATVFSMEVVSVGIMYYVALVPCIISSLLGYAISGYFGVQRTYYELKLLSSFDLLTLIQVVGLGILCALLSILFCKTLHITHKLYAKFLKNPYLRIIVGSLLIINLNLIIPSNDYLGTGMPTIEKALFGSAHYEAFALKILFTALTLGAGFKGGEIVPSFFVGATFGAAIGPFLGLSSSFSASLGLIALFCGVTNCPMTAFILSTEMFGNHGSIYFMLIIAISYMLSGYSGLYTKQKMMYSKFRPQFLNQLTH
ncbi:MAG: chloride channel protein [Cellulosilyticum sp.]|nr:chloride channel protein [Cellulosilyticum sp.]